MLRHPKSPLACGRRKRRVRSALGQTLSDRPGCGWRKGAERPESGGGRNVFALGWRSASSAAIKFQLRAALAAEVFYAAPPRGNTGHSVYFITASTFQKRRLFQSDRMAQLFIDVLLHYHRQCN